MNIITALKGYLAFHIACALVNLIFIYLNTGVTDYGGAAGFFRRPSSPHRLLMAPTVSPSLQRPVTTRPIARFSCWPCSAGSVTS